MPPNFRIPAGSKIQLGRAKQPLPNSLREKLKHELSATEGVVEAHLPLCYVAEMMTKPAEVLVVVLDKQADLDATMLHIGEIIEKLMPRGSHLDVWPLSHNHPLLSTIRKLECSIVAWDLDNQKPSAP